MARFCQSCGAPLADGVKFCTACGAKTETTPVPDVQPSAPQPQSPSFGAPDFRNPSYEPPQPVQPGQTNVPPIQAAPPVQQAQPTVPPVQTAPPVKQPQQTPPFYPSAPAEKKKSSDKVLIIALIVSICLCIGAGVFYFLSRNANKNDAPAAAPGQTTTADPTGSASVSGNSGSAVNTGTGTALPGIGGASSSLPVAVPAGAELYTDVTKQELIGDWTGEINFTKMDGYEYLPGAPDNILEMIASIMASPQPLSFEFEDSSRWTMKIQAMNGMNFYSTDFRVKEPATPEEENAHLFKDPEDGVIVIHPAKTVDPDDPANNGSFAVDMVVCKDSQGVLIVGTLDVTMTNDGITVVLKGTFTIRPSAGQ